MTKNPDNCYIAPAVVMSLLRSIDICTDLFTVCNNMDVQTTDREIQRQNHQVFHDVRLDSRQITAHVNKPHPIQCDVVCLHAICKYE